MKLIVISIFIGALGKVTNGLVQGLGEFGNKTTSGDYTNYCIVEIS